MNGTYLLLRALCLLSFLSIVAAETTTSETTSIGTPRRQDSIERFLLQCNQLDSLRGQHPILGPSHSKGDSSYTRNWNNDDWERHQVRSFYRYKRHLGSWFQSPTAWAVLPTVSVLLVWTCLVFLLANHLPPKMAQVLTKASFSTASFSAPVSLLLALRTNRALNRLLEARSMWGKMIRVTSSITSLCANYVQDETTTLLFARYLSIYGWTVKGLLRGEDDAAVLTTMLPPVETTWIQQSSPADTPTSIIFRLRQLLVQQELPLAAATALENRLCELEITLGVCKRLMASPIPPTYTRHTSRVLCLCLGLLPIAMIGSEATLFSTLAQVALLSYVFVGIDEIGVEIEHPFPLLPMYHLAVVMQTNVKNQCLMMAQGAPVP